MSSLVIRFAEPALSLLKSNVNDKSRPLCKVRKAFHGSLGLMAHNCPDRCCEQ